ncbi:MAG TPA: ROK family protein [Mycobacteriales bacterium]|nr:ROK family protein [Mycobacteriales bacterium]
MMSVNSADSWPPAGVRGVNLDTIVAIVRRRPEVTRADLIEASGLSKATVAGIVTELLGRGLLRESGKRSAGRGRSQVLLTFNSAARMVLGAQVEDERCTVVLADMDGAAQEVVSRPLAGPAPEAILDALTDAATEVRGRTTAPILGLGVGVPGDVDKAGRKVVVAVSHGWKDLDIADQLEQRVHLPVVAANRAKVAALGHLRGRGPDADDNLIYIFLGRGIVAGIVIDGQLYFGRDGAAGDIGHVTVHRDGMLCGCGNQGCLHTVASEGAILGLARAAARRAGAAAPLQALTHGRLTELNLAVLADAARRQDPDVVRLLADVGADIGIVVANLVNTLSPDAVVLGGPTIALGEALLDPIRQEIRRRALPEPLAGLRITESLDDGATGAAGAAALCIGRLPTVLRSLPIGNGRRPGPVLVGAGGA